MEEIIRTRYLNEIEEWRDNTEVIKIITGVRRCGKSVTMGQYRRRLLDSGVSEGNILHLDFESSDFDGIVDYMDLNGYISERIGRDVRTYILMDEVQRIDGWERTVNSLMVDYDADIYITGSNAYLLSSELSTYISGRYVEIKVLPFSFSEFLEMNPPVSDKDRNARFNEYLVYGGMPIMNVGKGMRYNDMLAEGIYNTILLKDISVRKGIRDVSGLDSVARFLFDNMGNITNMSNVASSVGLDVRTVKSYIQALEEAFLFYRAERYDIKGKKLLNTHDKYYSVDTGMARSIPDRGFGDLSHPLENAVYLELIRRGYRVRAGSFKDKEVDFTVERDGGVHYFQVCLTMLDEKTYTRETGSLREIGDSYPKTVLSLDQVIRPLPDGIRHMNVVDWLLSEDRTR